MFSYFFVFVWDLTLGRLVPSWMACLLSAGTSLRGSFFIDREQGWDALWEIILLIFVNKKTGRSSFKTFLECLQVHATPAWTVTDNNRYPLGHHWVSLRSQLCSSLVRSFHLRSLLGQSPRIPPVGHSRCPCGKKPVGYECWQKQRFFFGWQLTLASIMWNPNDQHVRFFNKWLKYA